MSARGLALQLLAALLGLLVLGLAAVYMLNRLDEGTPAAPGHVADEASRSRGRYLALAGNCMDCHTVRGGAPGAGGRAIETPFGTVYSSNLTPHEASGLGRWSRDDFWRALHNGRSRDGHLLYPAFPYPDYTRITRSDADDLFDWLRSLTAVDAPTRAHALRFPYSTQAALAVWRALFFRPGVYREDASRDARWNRGAYLVQGLGHCNACHSPRNALGASDDTRGLAGGMIPEQNWYAPSLAAADEAGVQGWRESDVVSLLQTGVSPRGWVGGPMADVVVRSTQHLQLQDLQAMASYLRALPPSAPAASARPAPGSVAPASARVDALGARLYEKHCQDCHGERGEGIANAYPALAGNRTVLMEPPANAVQFVLHGGFAPATQAQPRPFGMPPFGLSLDDREIAHVLNHIRNQWGNRARELSEIEVSRLRGSARE